MATPLVVGSRPLDELQPHPFNPRGPVVEDEALRELADSIREQGILQPLVVTPDGLIIAGHRRYAAARLAGLTEAPVSVRDGGMTDQVTAMLVENLQRADLTPLQTARACRRLLDAGLTVKDVARRIGKSEGWIYILINTLRLPAAILAEVESGGLSMSQAVALERFADQPAVLERLARDCRRYGLSSMWIKGLDDHGEAPDAKRYQPIAARRREPQFHTPPAPPPAPPPPPPPAPPPPPPPGDRALVVRYLHARAALTAGAVALALRAAAAEIERGAHLALSEGAHA